MPWFATLVSAGRFCAAEMNSLGDTVKSGRKRMVVAGRQPHSAGLPQITKKNHNMNVIGKYQAMTNNKTFSWLNFRNKNL